MIRQQSAGIRIDHQAVSVPRREAAASVGYQRPGFEERIHRRAPEAAREYVGFAVTMCLAFGGTFQLPIVIVALTALGLTTPGTLARYRRHAAIGSFIVASVITGSLVSVHSGTAAPV